MSIGIISDLVSFLPCFFLVQIFRRSRKRVSKTKKLRKVMHKIMIKDQTVDHSRKYSLSPSEKAFNENAEKISLTSENEYTPTVSGKSCFSRVFRRSFSLPWWSKLVAYALSLSASAVCIFCILMQGISLGDSECRDWLISLIFSVFSSMVLTQPLQVS